LSTSHLTKGPRKTTAVLLSCLGCETCLSKKQAMASSLPEKRIG